MSLQTWPFGLAQVVIECGGVTVARVQLGHVDSGVRSRDSSKPGGSRGDGGNDMWDARERGRRKECSSLDLVGEQRRYGSKGGK